MQTDTDIYDTILRRSIHLDDNMFQYSKFLENEKYFMDYFMNLSNNDIESCITYLPKGSIIFHGATCKTHIDRRNPNNTLPPLFPLIQTNETPITAIKRILNFESKRKAIGSVLALYPDDVQKGQEAVKDYNDKFFENNNKGVFVGKHYMWCNTTMDANIMVDIRLMESMTIFITNKDLYLLDFMKLSKKILANAYYIVDDIKLLFFKRWLNLTSETSRDEDNVTGNKYLKLDYTINAEHINLRLRNKFLNSIGEAVYFNILNYILSLKGLLFKIDGYADYDLSDMTPNLYDVNSNSISGEVMRSEETKYVCKEIMLSDGLQYLSYLGSHTIKKPDTEPITPEILLDIKKEVMDNIFSKLNKILVNNGKFIELEWCDTTDKLIHDTIITQDMYKLFHKNMQMMPHYHYKVSAIPELFKFIDLINTNTTNTVINNLGYLITNYDITDTTVVQTGGLISIEKIYNDIKNMSAKTTDSVITSEVFSAVIDHINTQNINDEVIQDKAAEKLAEKAAINSVVTKIFHSEFLTQELAIKFITRLCDVINKPEILNSIIKYLQSSPKGNTILNIIIKESGVPSVNNLKIDDFMVFYIKGSTSLYMNIVDIGSVVIDSCVVSDILSKTSLGNSDIDFNLCINPIILEEGSVFEDLVNYLSEISKKALEIVKHEMIDEFFTKELLEKYFSRCNIELTKLYANGTFDNEIIIDNLLNINYIYPIFELDFTLKLDSNEGTNSIKEYHKSMLTPLKLVTNKQIHQVIKYSDFVLLRLAISVRTNKYLPCICEIFDISVIKHKVESQFIWSHRKNVIIRSANIRYNNLLNELYDMNATLLNSVQFGITKKLDKRLQRYKLIEKLINCVSVDKIYRGTKVIQYVDFKFNDKLWSIMSLTKNLAAHDKKHTIRDNVKNILEVKPELETFIVDLLTDTEILYIDSIKRYDQKEILVILKFSGIYDEIAKYFEKVSILIKDKKYDIEDITSFKYHEYDRNLDIINNSVEFIIYYWKHGETYWQDDVSKEYQTIDLITEGHEKIIKQLIKEQNYVKTINKEVDPIVNVQIKPTKIHYNYEKPSDALKHIALLNTPELFIEQVNKIIPVTGTFINKEINTFNNTGTVEYLIATKNVNLLKIKVSIEVPKIIRGEKIVKPSDIPVIKPSLESLLIPRNDNKSKQKQNKYNSRK